MISNRQAFLFAVILGTTSMISPGQVPNDRRLGPLKELSGDYFPFEVPKSRQQWEQRQSDLKRRILVATGLWPMPDKTPLNPVIHGCVERDDFTVDKVYFESYPGHFVTGLLFEPKNVTGRLPGVLCPHGHGGRLQDYGEKGIREMIVRGAERFEGSGRYPKLARCAQLARMGCVTFIFDMIGYADSVQVSREVAHRFGKQRPEFDTKENWGFFATQAELRLQSIMGLQTWNSIRALDFLCGLPEVDSKRIGVNGAGPWVAAARAVAGADVDSAAIDTGGFRFANLESYRDVDFLPGAVKYGDLPALLALSAPQRLWICGETEESLGVVSAAYAASGQLQHLNIDERHQQGVSARIVQWLKQVKSRP